MKYGHFAANTGERHQDGQGTGKWCGVEDCSDCSALRLTVFGFYF